MNFDDVILNRRSIRKYLSNDVSFADIEKIIKSGILAPSAHNRQPWKVMVLDDDMKKQFYESLLKKKELDPSIGVTANIINDVPCLIAIFYDGDGSDRDNDMLSIGAFIENMHLECTNLGLGSLWIANTNNIKSEIKDITGVTLDCVSCLAIGYKDQDPKPRPRKSLEEITVK